MSQDNHKAGGSTQSETEKLKRKIQLLEEKNSQLEQQATEQEPIQKRTKIFEDWKIENESHLKSAKRRLKYHVREKNPKPPMAPFNFSPLCTGGCIKTFCHPKKSRNRQNEEFLRLHVCCICMELFKVAIFHQGFDCQTLRLIDEKIELEKQKAFCKILNQNAQIGTQK